MQQNPHKPQEDISPIETFKLLLYPEYPPGISSEQFLTYYQPLFQQLRKLDMASDEQFKKLQKYCPKKSRHGHMLESKTLNNQNHKLYDLQKVFDFIIDELNDLCTHCHRPQLQQAIIVELSSYKKQLKNMAFGKFPTPISSWEKHFYHKPKLENLQPQMYNKVLTIMDKLYIEHKRIPNYYYTFLTMPQTFINIYEFEQKIIFDSVSDKTSMPLVDKYYLGVIAAATYGSRYMWNLMTVRFLKHGGDIKWIEQGLDQLPQHLCKLSQVSYQMAYHFKINIVEDLIFQLAKILEDATILEGIYVLTYYHFLSSVTQVYGLVPECTENEKYLPQIPTIKPSLQSFQAMKKVSKREFKYEKQMAAEFEQMYTWDKDSDKENFRKAEQLLLQKKTSVSSTKKLIQKAEKMNKSLSYTQTPTTMSPQQQPLQSPTKQLPQTLQNQLMIAYEEQEIIRKIKSSKTMHNIENIYSKYVEFDKRRSLIEFKRKTKKKTRVSDSSGKDQLQSDSQREQEDDEFIYASEWNFENNAGNLMQSVIGHQFHKIVFQLIKSLKFFSNKQKSKNLKMYYQSLQNYMYEYISYVGLINDGLTQVERNYIKLLTRSPFLFNEISFIKMKQDLESKCGINEPFRFGLEIFSYKLEHSLSLSTYAYFRYLEDK